MIRWRHASFAEAIQSRGSGTSGLPQTEWAPNGKYPVIGQGAEYIEGWTDREDLVVKPDPALVLYGGHTRRAKLVDRPFVPGPNVKILVPVSELDATFLFRYLEQLKIESRGYADHFPEVRRRQIPIPPLPVQRRIAQILDSADALRAKRRAALAQLKSLAHSLFLDMFGDPVTNPKGIRKRPLGELVKLKSGDFLPAVEMAESGTYAVLGGNGISGFHDHYKFEDPQIVIGRVGAYCGCVHVSPAKSWITDNALYISERDPDLLFDYLVHALTQARLNQYASQFGQPLVSGSRIYPVPVLIPQKESQQEFVARAARSAELEGAYESSLNELDALFASLQHRAFQGDL